VFKILTDNRLVIIKITLYTRRTRAKLKRAASALFSRVIYECVYKGTRDVYILLAINPFWFYDLHDITMYRVIFVLLEI